MDADERHPIAGLGQPRAGGEVCVGMWSLLIPGPQPAGQALLLLTSSLPAPALSSTYFSPFSAS